MGSETREADIAFVLEDVPNVVGVYAIDGARHGRRMFDYAVRAQHGSTAAVHYALLRVMTRTELSRILLCQLDLPPGLAPFAREISLSVDQREAARARTRMRARSEGPPSTDGPCALIVDDDVGVVHVLESASLSYAQVHHCSDAVVAARLATEVSFWRIFCDVEHAFGDEGFLTLLGRRRPDLTPRIVLLASPSSAPLVSASMTEAHALNSVLAKPVDGTTLRRIWLDDVIIQQRIADPPPLDEAASRRTRVLVVDDATSSRAIPSSSESIDLVVTSDPWEALELAEGEHFDLVVCSPTMRTPLGMPLYRALWMVAPAVRARFAFVTSSEITDARGPVLIRPLTCAALVKLIPPRSK